MQGLTFVRGAISGISATFVFNTIILKMKTLFFLVPLFALLISCGTTSSDTVPQSFSESSGKGLAIGTITFEGDGPKNDIYRFFYRPTTGEKQFIKQNKGKIQIVARVDNKRTHHGDFNDSKTYLFVIEREPGTYSFNEYNYLTKGGHTGMVNSSKKFAIPFDIKKNEISYIGEFTYMENAEPGTPRIIVSDNMERDLPEFKRKFRSGLLDKAANKTPKSGDTGGGVVDFR